MAQEKEYFAFISYQRKDEEWADRLRSKLEHYRLPSSVRKLDASLPKGIRPIFRDALELAGGILAKEIETALQNSKYLIVICSPNSAKSPWVNKEIQTFMDLSREDRIIPFIIDGTPFSGNEETECYPPALRSLKEEKELLGININELSRDAAAIKVVARMFGLKFDTLWQRYEREQRRKRWMWIGGAIVFAIFGLSIGGYFVKQNSTIERQKERLQQDSITMTDHLQKISAQNDSIASQNNLILSQRDSIEHSVQQLQLSNRLLAEERDRAEKTNISLSLAKDSIQRTNRLLENTNASLTQAIADLNERNLQLKEEKNRVVEANNTYSHVKEDLKQYVSAGELRGNSCDELWLMHFDYHPYEPLVAFSDDWGVWIHYINSNIEKLLPIDEEFGFGEVSRLCFSPDGSELMAEGFFGIYIWNVEKCELLKHLWLNDNYVETNFPEINNDSLIERRKSQLFSTIDYTYIENRLTIYNKTDSNYSFYTDMDMCEDSFLRCIPNPVYNEVLFITEKRAALFDINKKEFVLFFKGYEDVYGFEFDNTGEVLRVDKTVYTRTISPDTIQILRYTTQYINDYPFFNKIMNNQYDEATRASIESNEFAIKYRRGSTVKEIEVLKQYTTGNGQEFLLDPIFAGSNKIVAIVEQGKHRIYTIGSLALIGTLDNYVWDGKGQCFGYECQLSHAESYIVTANYINNKLYVVSSGGIVRVYNVNRPRLEAVIELPIRRENYERVGCIDKIHISEDASRIYYSFENQNFFYVCVLPQLKN